MDIFTRWRHRAQPLVGAAGGTETLAMSPSDLIELLDAAAARYAAAVPDEVDVDELVDALDAGTATARQQQLAAGILHRLYQDHPEG